MLSANRTRYRRSRCLKRGIEKKGRHPRESGDPVFMPVFMIVRSGFPLYAGMTIKPLVETQPVSRM